MLELIFWAAVFVIVTLVVDEKVWLTIHRTIRKWVKAAINKIAKLSE